MNIASGTPVDLPSQGSHFWRSLRYFSYYRITVALIFLGGSFFPSGELGIGSQNPVLFRWACVGYLLIGCAYLLLLERWRHAFNLQLTLQVAGDILFLTVLMFASGGGKSGLGMMLLIVLTGAGLVGQGRMALFYAALATVSLLLEQAYRVLEYHGEVGDFFRTGLTSAGFFGTAITARLLASRVIHHENVARRRGIELADQMRINERVIRDMQDGVLVVDAAGRVRQANPKAAALLGFAATLPESLAVSAPILAQEYLARRERGIESEAVLRMPTTGGHLRVRFMPPGEGGNSVIFLEDMGRLEQEAQQMKLAALGRLTANMAHEIRNPLAAISHAAELLGDGTADPGTKRLVRIIGDNAQRLNRLVVEVTELGRRDRASPELIDLAAFLGQLIEELTLRDPAIAKRITCSLPAQATACFDRGHLHRVIANLLDNALRYASDAEGAVRIIAEPDVPANRLQLHVIDDGPGIDAAVCGQVFEPFFTVRAGGTGLGLYIARELCEANGARLTLRAHAPSAHFCISCALTCPERNRDRHGK